MKTIIYSCKDVERPYLLCNIGSLGIDMYKKEEGLSFTINQARKWTIRYWKS